MKKGVVNFKTIGINGVRLDSKYHLSDGLIAIRKINKLSYSIEPLLNVTTNIFNGPRFKRIYVSNHLKGIPFMGSSDMLRTHLGSLKLISNKYSKNITSLKIKENWILVSCSGTIGNTVFTNKSYVDKTASQHIMRIIPDKYKIKEGFLYAYLSSKYGYALLTQGTYGAVIQHIEPMHIENIPVPIFPESKQQEIHNLIVESANLRVEANRLLEEATVFFDQLMKYENNISYKTISIRNIRNRFDSYSVLENNIIDSIIDKNPSIVWIPIKNISEKIFIGPRSKRKYVQKGIPFLSGSELQKSNPTKVEKFLSIKDATPFIVNKDWVLITRSGTIGNVTYVFPVLDGYGATDDAIRVVVKASSKLSSKYLYAFLVSKFGHKCIQKDIFGSVIQHINEEQLGNILIPVLDINKVEEKIERYCSFMNDAIIKENQAIQLVEKEIESWQ